MKTLALRLIAINQRRTTMHSCSAKPLLETPPWTSPPHSVAKPRLPPMLMATAANGPSSRIEALDVAVIGGGPGGLAAANAILTTRPDLQVAVFERSLLRPRGAAIMVAPNGIKALQAINPALAEAVLGIDSTPASVRIHSADGTLLTVQTGEQTYISFIKQRGGPLSLCAWHALQSTLASQLPPGVLHQQVAYDRYEEGPNGVTVHFKGDSHPPVTAKVLVGCDGGQSAVRAQCIGDGPPLFAGTSIWRAVLEPPDWWPADSEYLFFGEAPVLFTAYKLHDGSVAWLGMAPWPDERLAEIGGRRAAYIQDPASRVELGKARRQRVLDVFSAFSWQVRSLVEAADPLAITEHPQLYRPPESCRVWGKGRITLTGDAAHLATPVLAQGSSQALEDAVALGRAIGQLGPTPVALRAYEAFRQPQARVLLRSGQMEVVHRTSVQEFLLRGEGKPTKPEHELGDELGVRRRSFTPLSAPAGAAT